MLWSAESKSWEGNKEYIEHNVNLNKDKTAKRKIQNRKRNQTEPTEGRDLYLTVDEPECARSTRRALAHNTLRHRFFLTYSGTTPALYA